MAKQPPKTKSPAIPSWSGLLFSGTPDKNPTSSVTSFKGGDGKNDVGLVAGYDQNEVRASNQTTGEKFRNGLAKLAGTAATSFLEPFADLSVGLLTAGTKLAEGEDLGASARGLYDNAATQQLDKLNEYMAEQFPNYYSQAEQQKSLWGQVGTANFWADKVGNGLGFMLGAVASGLVTGGAGNALKASRIAKGIAGAAELAADVTKGTQAGEAILGAVSKAAGASSRSAAASNALTGLVGALGESGMEARQIAKDTGIAVRKQLLADKGLNPDLYEDYTFSEQEEKHIADLEEAAGNSGFAYNLALVGGTNALLLPKIFRKGYQAERVALSKITQSAETGLYEAAALTGKQRALQAAKNVVLGNLEEATQEQLQFALEKALPDYYKKQRDTHAKMDVQEYMASMASGLQEAYGSKEGWENGLLGAIIGLAGAHSAIAEVGAEEATTQAAVGTLNAAIAGKPQQALFKAMVAANAYAKENDGAVATGNQKAAQDAAHGAFASMVRGYSQAGKFDDLVESLQKMGQATPEEFKAANGFAEDAELGDSPAALSQAQIDKAKAIQKLSQEIEAAYPGDGMSDARDMFFGLASQMQNSKERESKLIGELTKATGISLDAFKLTDQQNAWDNFNGALNGWLQQPDRSPLEAQSVLEKATDAASLANERIQLAQYYRLLEDPKHRESAYKAHQAQLAAEEAAVVEDEAKEAEAAAENKAPTPPPAPAAGAVAPKAPVATTVEPEGTGIVVQDAEGRYRKAVFDKDGKLLHWIASEADGTRKGANNMAANRFPDLEADAKAGFAYAQTGQAAPAPAAPQAPTPPAAPTPSPAPAAPSAAPDPAPTAPSAATSILLGGAKPAAPAAAPTGPTDAQKAVVAKLEALKEKAPSLTADESGYANDEDTYGRASGMKKKLLSGRQQVPEDDSFLKNNPQFADRGNIVDLIVREYFLEKGTIGVEVMKVVAKEYAERIAENKRRIADGTANVWDKLQIEDSFYTELLANLDLLKGILDKQGWVVLSDVPTLHGVIDGEKLAGTMDLVAVNKDGGAYIIDLKTQEKSRRADYLLPDVGKGKVGRFGAEESKYREGDLIQQAVYAELLKQRTGIEVLGRLIFPMITDGGKGKTTKAVYTSAKLEEGTNAAGTKTYSINLGNQQSVGQDAVTELGKLDINGLIKHYLGRDANAGTSSATKEAAPAAAPTSKLREDFYAAPTESGLLTEGKTMTPAPAGYMPLAIQVDGNTAAAFVSSKVSVDAIKGDGVGNLGKFFDLPAIIPGKAINSFVATTPATLVKEEGSWKVQDKGVLIVKYTDGSVSSDGKIAPAPIVAPVGLQPGTSFPSDYYAQTAFSGADASPAQVAARAQYQKNLANPQHPQSKTLLAVQRVQSGSSTYYNLVTDVLDDEGKVAHPTAKVGYLANTTTYQAGKVESPGAAAARAGQVKLKEEIDAYFAANPAATHVGLRYTKSAAFAGGKEGLTLAELDNRFTLNGTLRVFTQRSDAFSGKLLPKAITGKAMSAAERKEIAVLRETGREGALTDGYVLAVTAPDGVGTRYIAAKTKSVAGGELQEVFDKAAANVDNLSGFFFVADQPNMFLRYSKGSWEVQQNAEEGSGEARLLGYLRLKKGATISSLQDFQDNLTFVSASDSTATAPGSYYLRDVRYELPAKATEQQLKELLVPTTGPSLYDNVSIQPQGIVESTPEVAPASVTPDAIKLAAQSLAKEGEVKPKSKPTRARTSTKSVEDEQAPTLGAMKVAAEAIIASDSFKEASAQFAEIVGDNFASLGLAELPANVYRDGQTMAVFLGNAAYFSEQTQPGTGYHEAGHAVFRGMLTKEQRAAIYEVASRRLGATAVELADFRASSLAYERLSDADLRNLLLEEKVMDGFMAYKAGKPAGFFGKIFRYLRDALATLLSSRDAISELYYQMDKGAFRASRPVSAGFEQAAYKNVPFTTVEQSKRMIGLLTVRYMRAKEAGLLAGKSKETILRELIAQRFLEDTVEWEDAFESEELLNTLGLYLPEDVEEGMDEDSLYRKAYKNPQSIAVLIEQVLKQEKVLEFNELVDEEGDASDDVELQSEDGVGKEVKESFSKGGYLEAKAMANVSQEIRLLLSLTTYTDSAGLEQVVDFDQTVSILERILENKRTYDEMEAAIAARVKLGENAQLNAVYQELLVRTRTADGELFKRKFQQGLYRILLTPVQFTFADDGSSKAFNADSTHSVEKARVAQWADRWVRTKVSHAEAKAAFGAIDEALFTEENATDHEGLLYGATELAKAASKLGMDLSKTFIYDVLAGQSEDYVWRASGDEADVRRSLADDLGQFARYQATTNPFLAELDGEGRRADAETRALNLAKADANYQDTILNPSYRNAENKSQYAYTQASYLLEKARDLQDGKFVRDAFTALNPLLAGPLAVETKSLQLEYLAGVRREDDVTGQSYGNMDAKVYLLMGHLAYRGNTGAATASGYRRVIYGQLEAKSTAFTFQVPSQEMGTFSKDGQVTDVTVGAFKQFLAYQEAQIARVWAEIDDIVATGELGRAVKNVHFSKYKDGKPVLPTRETAAKDLPRGLRMLITPGLHADNAQEYAQKMQEQLLAVHKGQLSDAGFDLTDKKVQALLGYGNKAGSFDDYLREYLLHDFIYRESYSQLTRGNEAWFKDAVDITKRGGGLIAAGPSFGEGEYPMYPLQTDAFHIYTENMKPVSPEDQALLDSGEASDELKDKVAQVDATDAQGYCTAKRFAFLQRREAKLDKSILARLDKFAAGEDVKPGGGWTGISMKNVYYGEEHSNGATYLKMSVFPLFREVTSFQAKNGKWVAKPGMEQLHNLRVRMEEQETDNEATYGEAYHDTAIKAGLRSLNFREQSGQYGKLSGVTLSNNSLRRQVSNPSGKEKVVDPTQLLQILDSGMEDADEFVYTNSRGEEYETSVGELRKSFQGLLSSIKLDANTKYADFQKLVLDGQSLGKRAILDGLEASMADENTLAFFGQGPNGEWSLSPDMPVIQQKAQQLVLAGFNKSVFSQKVPGTKRSLVSSAMARVIVREDGSLAHDWAKPYAEQEYVNADGSLKEGYMERRLAMHQVIDGKVQPAEIIVSEELLMKKGITLAMLYGPNTSEATRNAILEEVGLRIPSQDKHSIIPCKIVGWLPAYMGSVVMAPSQITYLSGADYDIDSLFSLQRAYYAKSDGGVALYGGAESEDAYVRWEEYNAYQRDKHPAFSRLVNERLAIDVHYQQRSKLLVKHKAEARALKEAQGGKLTQLQRERVGQITEATNRERERVEAGIRKVLGMPATYEDFKKLPVYKQTNGYAQANALMDTRMGLALNPHDYPAARSPVELDSLKADAKVISKATGAGLDLPLPYNSTPVIAQHHIDNGVGLANVGVAAKANNSGVFLTKIGYRLPIAIKFGERWLTGYKDKSEHDIVLGADMDGKPAIVGTEDRRKQDTSSAHISSATDNAKEKLAALLNLSMPMLGVVMNLVHLSVGRTRSLVFANQPILRLLAQRKMAADSIIPGFEDSRDVTRNLRAELTAWLGVSPKGEEVEEKKAEYTLKQLLDKAVAEEQYELAKHFKERLENTPAQEQNQVVVRETGDGLNDTVMVAALSQKLEAFVTKRGTDGGAYAFTKMDVSQRKFVEQQLEVLIKFAELEDFTTSWFGPVGRILGLNKGVGSTFGDMRKFREAGDKITPYKFTNQKPEKPNPYKIGQKPFIYLSAQQVGAEKALDANLVALQKTASELAGKHILATETVEDFTAEHRSYGLRADAVDLFQNGFLAHLAVNGYQDLAGLRLADYQYLLTDEKKNIATQWTEALAKFPDLEKNPFVYNTQNKKPDAKGGVPYYRRVFNTRADFSPQVLESITDGVSALLTDRRPEVRELMRLTYLYEGVKNNFQYKNESLIRLFPAVVHGKQAQALRLDLANLVSGERYRDQFMAFGRNWYSVPDNRRTLKPFGKEIEEFGPDGPETTWVLESYAKRVGNTMTIDLSGQLSEGEMAMLASGGVRFDENGNPEFPDFFSTTQDVQVSMTDFQTVKSVWMRKRPLRFSEKRPEQRAAIEKAILAGNPMPESDIDPIGHALYELVPENRSAWYQATYHLSAAELEAQKAAKTAAAPTQKVDSEQDVQDYMGEQDERYLDMPDALDLDAENYLNQQPEPVRAAPSAAKKKMVKQPDAWQDETGVAGGDGGSRLAEALAADMSPYVQDLLNNWEQVMQKSLHGLSLEDKIALAKDLESGKASTTCFL